MENYLLNNIVARITENRRKNKGGSMENPESHSSNKPTVFIYSGYFQTSNASVGKEQLWN